MANYSYRAIAPDGSTQSGKLRAENEVTLERVLNLRGLTLIEANRAMAGTGFLHRTRKSINDSDLLELTYLLMLVNASGVPILEGLNDVLAGREKSRLEPVFEVLANGLRSGLSLSGVMRERSDIFPVYYAQIINAGEVSGTLDKSINYLMSYLDWQINFKKTVRTFLRYPLIILSLLAALTGVLFAFVFPSLGNVLDGLNTEMPLPTRIIFSIADFVNANFVVLVAVACLSFIALRLILKTKSGRSLFDQWALKLPMIGELVIKINLSRYFKTLATLMGAGLDIQSTFTTASEVSSNTLLKKKLKFVTNAVTTGEDVSTALRGIRVVQPLVISMVLIGEKTGNLDGALTRASEIFDKEVPETIKKVFAFVEPMTVVMLGIMLLIVLLSIFLPIYSVVGNINVR